MKEFGAIASFLIAASGCAGPTRGTPDVCERLAHPIELIARNKDGGYTKTQQIEMLGEPDTTHLDQATHHGMLAFIDLVYSYPDLDASEIRNLVLSDCVVNAQGQASLPTLFPD